MFFLSLNKQRKTNILKGSFMVAKLWSPSFLNQKDWFYQFINVIFSSSARLEWKENGMTQRENERRRGSALNLLVLYFPPSLSSFLPFPSVNSNLTWSLGLCLKGSDTDFLIGPRRPSYIVLNFTLFTPNFPKVFCRRFAYFLSIYSCIHSSNKHLLSVAVSVGIMPGAKTARHWVTKPWVPRQYTRKDRDK